MFVSLTSVIIIRRKKGTFEKDNIIHGGTTEDPSPAIHGVLDTMAKSKSEDLASKIIREETQSGLTVEKKYVHGWVSRYYRSSANIIRSLNTY